MSLDPPRFSIVVPTYRRPAHLEGCLEAIARLTYPKTGFEVIVVDDGSPAPMENVVASFRERLRITLLVQSNAGPAAARNAGAARARGQFLCFTDDDCRPAPDWLEKLEERFALMPDAAVGGRVVNALDGNICAAASQAILDAAYDYFNRPLGSAVFVGAANLAVPARAFLEAGGFDPRFTTSEDREFCDRWVHRGHRLIHAPEAIVYHAHALTPGGFWRQQFDYGRGAFRFQKLRVTAEGRAVRVDAGFYLHLVRYPLSSGFRPKAVLISGLVAAARVVYIAGYACERWRRPPPDNDKPETST